MDQITFFNKQVASKDVSGYYLVKKGEFAYNKSYSSGYPWGAIKRLDNYDKGVLSTLYIVFKPIDIASDFLVSYYDTTFWYKEVSMRAAEGARNHGLLNISAQDFFETELVTPTQPEEQEKIGAFFKQLDDTIDLHQRQLDNYKELKKAMLQKMFPQDGETVPEIRFACFTEKWEQHKLETVVDVNSGRDYKHLSEGDIPVYGTGGYMISVNEALSYDRDGIGIGRKGTIDSPYILKAPYWTVDTLFYTIPKKGFDLNFVFSIFQNINWKKFDESTGVPSLSKATINSVISSFPSLEEQAKIGSFFKQLDDTIILHQDKIERLQSLKKNLLNKMFA